ncbi:MAG: DUF359 domain-containing protein [Euryarchaeota archaeon]
MLKLQKELRSELKKPLGDLYPSFKEALDLLSPEDFIISVGDVTTKNLIESGICPRLAIIDNRIQRKDSNQEINYSATILKAENPPGTITKALWETIEKALSSSQEFSENFLIIVSGEEDLAVLPCILLAPEDSVILYGQPNEGLVMVKSQKVKKKVEELINRFEEE